MTSPKNKADYDAIQFPLGKSGLSTPPQGGDATIPVQWGEAVTCGHPEWDVRVAPNICVKFCKKCGKAYYMWANGGPWSGSWKEIKGETE